jgi:5S rRNA maturation endonuclease (ribonuclease M5)
MLIVSPHFAETIYLSAFFDQKEQQLKTKIDQILPLTKLSPGKEILILHDQNYDGKQLAKIISHSKVQSYQFDTIS